MTSSFGTERHIVPSASLSTLRQGQHPHGNQQHDFAPNRTTSSLPLPPSSALPNSYEIPSLRTRTERKQTNASHEKKSRATSGSLPGLFGGRKDKEVTQPNDAKSVGVKSSIQSSTPRSRSGLPISGSRKAVDSQTITGSCMTCASTVRWPQGVKVFRCTTCSTVNDLEVSQTQDGFNGWSIASRKPVAISLDKTRKLIDQCVDVYLRHELERLSGSSTVIRAHATSTADRSAGFREVKVQEEFSITDRAGGGAKTTSHSHSYDEPSSTVVNTNQIRSEDQPKTEMRQYSAGVGGLPDDKDRKPKHTETSAASHNEVAAYIFKDVESYVASCLSGCTILNASFFSIRSAGGDLIKTSHSAGATQQHATPRKAPPAESDTALSELDAKTLLLGDFAENGSWWTGRPTREDVSSWTPRERSPDQWRGVVSAKTPRINWFELDEWYKLLIHAGEDWQARWRTLDPKGGNMHQQPHASSLSSHIQLSINDSKLHLQRTLLKSTENLLKRPRRPLKSPEDCRFLLMLLSNPLLHYSTRQFPQSHHGFPLRKSSQPSCDASSVVAPSSKGRGKPYSTQNGSLGHHTGIVKRILGLLSNLPDENHQFLVSWMARFSDNHFQRLVELVGGFITYRLSKQQDRKVPDAVNPTDGLVPSFSDAGEAHAAQLHAALSQRSSHTAKKTDSKPKLGIYSEDWQVRAAARFMSLLFQANLGHTTRKRELTITGEQRSQSAGLNAKYHAYMHGQILPISAFYSTALDHADLIGDFEAWETTKSKFTFCQYPFFLSIWAKIHIMEHDARRQMEVKAREAFFDSILSRRAVSQFLVLKVRRDCLADDSLRSVSQVVGSGTEDIKKGLRIDFIGEEGIDAGGLRKEWFLLLVREIFDPQHGLFLYDEDSQYCYFNPYCFESSEQFFLVGVLLGLAIYNSTILDIAFPPFVFKKMLASAPSKGAKLSSTPKVTHEYTLEDLAEYRPALAKGLRQLLDFDGDVQTTFCRDFVVEMDKYGEVVQIPLRPDGEKKPVTNTNRREFVDLYVRYLLDTAVARQYEPFKRGFFSVCGGNALSLFQPEEIELLVRGSDEPLDVASLRIVATYDNWPKEAGPPETQPQVVWFWQTFEQANPPDQRKLLSFITGSDRIPAMGTTNLTIRVQCIRDEEAETSHLEIERFPIARTCFNTINLYRYLSKQTLETKLWMAVRESEGFGLK